MQLLKYMHTDHSHNEEYKCLILENNLLGQIICISELHTPTARMTRACRLVWKQDN